MVTNARVAIGQRRRLCLRDVAPERVPRGADARPAGRIRRDREDDALGAVEDVDVGDVASRHQQLVLDLPLTVLGQASRFDGLPQRSTGGR